MNKLMAILLMTATMSGQVMAARTGQEGGGGDASDARVNEIRSDLLNWINNGGAKELALPKDISYGQYFDSMTDILQPKKVIVEFTNDKVLVKKVEKTCKGFITRFTDQAHIQCNITRFKETSEAQQYRLIHHEYAGLVNIERNEGALSDYEISSQVTDYLEAKTVLRLAVKKAVKKPDPIVYKNEAAKVCALKKDELEAKYFANFETNGASMTKGQNMINDYYNKNGLNKITSIRLINTEIQPVKKLDESNINIYNYIYKYKIEAGTDSATIIYTVSLFQIGLKVQTAVITEHKDKLGRITSSDIDCKIVTILAQHKNFGYQVPDMFNNSFKLSLINEDTNFRLSVSEYIPYYENFRDSYYTFPR